MKVLRFMLTCKAILRTPTALNRDYGNLTFAQKAVAIQGPWTAFRKPDARKSVAVKYW